MSFVIQVVFLVFDQLSESQTSQTSNNRSSKEVSQSTILIIAISFGVVAVVVCGFGLFHCYLNIRGKTTREFVKNKPTGADDDAGTELNDTYCVSTTPYLNFRQQVIKPNHYFNRVIH